MLSAELVILHLFNREATEDSRAKMARALLGYLSLWTPGEILIDPVSQSFPLLCCLLLYLFLLPRSPCFVLSVYTGGRNWLPLQARSELRGRRWLGRIRYISVKTWVSGKM